MRRIIQWLAVATLMVAMMLASAVPVLAAKGIPNVGQGSQKTFEDGSFQITGGGKDTGGGRSRSSTDGTTMTGGGGFLHVPNGKCEIDSSGESCTPSNE